MQVNLYYIFYGNWTHKQEDLITYWGNHISSTKWWEIVYLPDNNNQIAGKNGVSVKMVVHSELTQGTTLNRPTIVNVVLDNLNANKVPFDPDGVYFVLTSLDIVVSDQCGVSCGFHSFSSYKGTPFVYGWVGEFSSSSCNPTCIPSQNTVHSPNGDVGVDGVINVMGHELAESVTNPFYDAWQGDPNAVNEIADLCVWM